MCFKLALFLFQFLSVVSGPRPHGPDMELNCYESLLIVLDTLEKCLSNQPKDTARFDEAMNVKLLLREICQFIG
jgi:neurofibromin 1